MSERIQRLILSTGMTGFYFDDQKAIKAGATQNGFLYPGAPCTPGFQLIRQAGESLSIQIELSNGRVAWGDAAAIQYSGAGGRDPVFKAASFIPLIQKEIAPKLVGLPLDFFRPLVEMVDSCVVEGRPLHTALRYGLSLALLDAVALARNEMPCDTLAREFGGSRPYRPVKIFSQSGDDRYLSVDKMILKRVEVLPHALINNVSEKLGANGEKLLEYVVWLRNRILTHRPSPDYAPDLHIDVYGTIGMAFGHAPARMADYLATLEKAAHPFPLRIEGPVDMGARGPQIEALALLRRQLKQKGIHVGLVADEWCNSTDDVKAFIAGGAVDMVQVKTPVLGGIQHSVTAIQYCKQHGIGAYLGGTCNETDRSAQLCVHVALATQPDQMLAKPGMGVDEGFMIVHNEMRRALARAEARGDRS